MFSTVVNSVFGYFSKAFFVSSFLPVLAFVFFNAAAAYVLFEPAHDWLDRNFVRSPGQAVFATGVLLLGVLLAAYVVSGLGNWFRKLMEGGNWPAWIVQGFIPVQERRFEELNERIGEAAIIQGEFSEKAEGWRQRLSDAANTPGQRVPFVDKPEVAKLIADLDRRRRQTRLIPTADMELAVTQVEDQLRMYEIGPALDSREVLVRRLIRYGGELAVAEHRRRHNERYMGFGTQLAPTYMGNIASSIQSYAERRYNCNLALFVTQLLQCVQKTDKEAFAAVQDAKAQLDFLINCSWLTLFWSVIWVVILGVCGHEPSWFAAVAVAGPLLAYWWYSVAIEQYIVFADVLRTALDSFRFEVLKALRVSLPGDVDDERRMWDALNGVALYDEGHWEKFRYRHPG